MQTIMLAYDGASAEHALQRAAMLAKSFGSRLIVATVVPVQRDVIRGGPTIENRDRYESDLDAAHTYLAEEGLEAEYVELTGEPGDELAALAEQRGADMVVIGHHHHHLVERLLGQSVSDALAAKTHADVLLVH
jgi:nucleotide-binding universal stress UspA family protein